VIATLQKEHRLPAHPANNKRGDGLNLMATLLTNDRLTIDPGCVDSIAEFTGYRWAERTDPNDKTRYATKTPVDHHADAHDARRYGCMAIDRLGGRRQQRSMVTIQTRVEQPQDVGKAPLAQKLRRRMREKEHPQSVRVR